MNFNIRDHAVCRLHLPLKCKIHRHCRRSPRAFAETLVPHLQVSAPIRATPSVLRSTPIPQRAYAAQSLNALRNQSEIIKHLGIYLCSTLEAGHHRCRRRSACLYIWLHRPMRHIPGAPPPLEPALISHARFNHVSIPHPSHAPMDMLRHMEERGANTPIIRCNVATATPMTKNEADMAVLIALQRGASIGLQRPAAPTLTTNNAPHKGQYLRRP